MGNVDSVRETVTEVTVPEAARRLGLPGDDVYRLIFRGVLAAGPQDDGAVYVSVTSLEAYLARQPPDTAGERDR